MEYRNWQHHHWKYVICFLLLSVSVSEQFRINSNKELKKMKEACKQEKQKLESELQKEVQKLKNSGKDKQEELRKEIHSNYSDDCKSVDNFKKNQLTEDEVKSWLNTSKNDVSEVYEILKGADKETLKELMKTEKDGWLRDPEKKTIFTALGEEIIKKLGGSRRVTVADLQDFGSAAVYMIRPVDYRGLSDEVVKYILGLISEETQKSLQENFVGNVDEGVIPTVMLYNPNEARIKALCRRTFHLYKKSRDLNTDEGWQNIKHLLFCAPPGICKSVDNNLIQSDIGSVAVQQWTCRTTLKKIDVLEETYINGLSFGEYILQMEKRTRRLFPSNRPCGKILAEKLVTGGKMPYEIKELDDIDRLKFFAACLPENVLKGTVDSLGCDFAADVIERGFLNQKLSNYAAKKCASTPVNIEDVTCENLETIYKPYLKSMKRSFIKNLAPHTMCNATCMELFKEQLPEDMMKYIMKKCYKNTDITSDEVEELGGLVMDLPMDKFEEITAQDLEKNIKKIKKDLRAKSKKRRKVVLKKLAKKLIDDGSVADLIDSREIMKEVSLKDLKKSLVNSSDVIQDLGIGNVNGSLGMTDSQKKWVMKEVVKKKQLENFQVEDLREMKSLVTGLLSSHIKKIAEAHTEDSSGMELAAEMCSHSDWPRKSLEAINRYLIHGSLKVRNSTDPMSTLTAVDVQDLGCHCLLNFDASKYVDMDKDVCSAMCMKIGYCDTFRCLNPTRKKNVLQACLKCKSLGTEVITDTDFDELGPNLISQMSKAQLDLIPAQVFNSGIEFFKDMCMEQTLRTAVSEALQEVIGRSGADYSSETLYLLGSAIKLLPRSLQQQLDKNVLAEMQSALIEELAPATEEDIRLRKCCEKWLDETDLENLKEQNFNLMLTVKEAIFSQTEINGRRRKRASNIFIWTCRQIRAIPILFLTASSEEINIMDEEEFLDCLPIIGSLTGLKDWQRSLLLAKVKMALSEASVCEMDVIENLGVIALAFSSKEISCLPLNDSSVVTSLGSLNGWSRTQLRVLAKRYVSANNLTTLSRMSSSDITMLGPIICGFTIEWIATVSSVELGQSGEDVGKLKECKLELFTAFANLAVQEDAYGPVHTWDAADVTELKYIVAGLSGAEIMLLNLTALEGLDVEVIPVIPETVLKEMSTTQLKAFADTQVHSITNAQKEVMTIEQRVILGDMTTMPTTVIIGEQHGNSGSAIEMTVGSLLSLVVMTLVVL